MKDTHEDGTMPCRGDLSNGGTATGSAPTDEYAHTVVKQSRAERVRHSRQARAHVLVVLLRRARAVLEADHHVDVRLRFARLDIFVKWHVRCHV